MEEAVTRLREIATQHDFSVVAGDLIYLNNGWYVTHTGLIGLARRKRCSGIHVEAVDSLCDSGASRFVLKATTAGSYRTVAGHAVVAQMSCYVQLARITGIRVTDDTGSAVLESVAAPGTRW